ncbi:MAG: hypothetical protein COV55_01865 [Candidatus Komeilibacteria bacterium CG11_big_fil_rev_8_21_14_0_20_36_20]|uniref:Uncharacterized protein n=1 Tax=Candidatus Komeilibacteria bacterium CG11_big_fil_rev_8_21_14_0_20_36_20 TaxID=1974477 RepID=A0A2H0NGF7_9BACT|nr:MAG: hypothetical protein COV55_01865 [Candidatus Komeilibacteria bacterium CG11_big_fil_rev_8_21_14_0_20_36_20]PIR81288.1 MAG: hypothetical protein COU21_04850 [Candidatus Komeilibacteria bacterium CG10_big_fil_rev_8_21_14_0_10_36_65]PJC55252.1 MAG: hypothetical protein CO027_03790 [Candidatus Komeilibacteria bacterium CG_4_9_14_0_2_um_filter_36_13]
MTGVSVFLSGGSISTTSTLPLGNYANSNISGCLNGSSKNDSEYGNFLSNINDPTKQLIGRGDPA